MSTKQCQHCKGQMWADAKTCSHCGKDQVGVLEQVGTAGCLLLATWPLLFIIGFILYAAIF